VRSSLSGCWKMLVGSATCDCASVIAPVASTSVNEPNFLHATRSIDFAVPRKSEQESMSILITSHNCTPAASWSVLLAKPSLKNSLKNSLFVTHERTVEYRMIPAASVCSSQSLRRNVSARQYELANKWRFLRLVSWCYVPP
jgi:hypothetical protein